MANQNIDPIPVQRTSQLSPIPRTPDNAALFFERLKAQQEQEKMHLEAQKVLGDSMLAIASLMEKKRQANMENDASQAMLDLRNRSLEADKYKDQQNINLLQQKGTREQELQDWIMNSTAQSTSVGGKPAVIVNTKSGPHVTFAPQSGGAGGANDLDASDMAALKWGVANNILAPAQVAFRGPKSKLLAAGIRGRSDFQEAFKNGTLTENADNFDPMAADASFSGTKSEATALGGKGGLIKASSASIIPNLVDLDKMLGKEMGSGTYTGIPALDRATLSAKSGIGNLNAAAIKGKAQVAADEIQANFGVGSDKKLDLALNLLRTGSLQQQRVGVALASQALRYRIDAYSKPIAEGQWIDPHAGEVLAVSADGQKGFIPIDDISGAIKEGYQLVP